MTKRAALIFMWTGAWFVSLQTAERLSLPIPSDEVWWAGVIDDGWQMPFAVGFRYHHDFLGDNKWNQIQPLLISNRGRYIWSEEPFAFEFKDDTLYLQDNGKLRIGKAGETLREAYLFAAETFFPFSGKMPDEILFQKPQFNTWIELTYNQNQQDILAYARAAVANGFSPGAFMIDASWQQSYGDWLFRADRFPDPKAMIEELHALGFKVMLWVCPFVTADSPTFRMLRDQGALIRNLSDDKPAVIEWWDGFSALLDLTHPQADKWFREQLQRLACEYGIDGFKFDAGDSPYYLGRLHFHHQVTPNRQTELYAAIGLQFSLNEYRACWKMGGQPLAQRLHDKNHSWQDLRQLIPNTFAQALSGYAFSCPDMIGGGEIQSFLHLSEIDQELVVRSAQCQALMPMMQFSAAPWRILSAENLRLCKAAADLHLRFADHILQLARHAAETGEPIVRPLEYVFPHMGYEHITDQFMLGDDILVAPVLEKGAHSRNIIFPPGVWQDENGNLYRGHSQRKIDSPLARLPWFIKTRK